MEEVTRELDDMDQQLYKILLNLLQLGPGRIEILAQVLVHFDPAVAKTLCDSLKDALDQKTGNTNGTP